MATMKTITITKNNAHKARNEYYKDSVGECAHDRAERKKKTKKKKTKDTTLTK